MDRKWLSLIGLFGLVALLWHDDKTIGQLSELKRRRSRRLYYISNGKVVPHSEVNTARRVARAGYGKVFAVWAYNADEAREYIRQGKAETVSGLDAKMIDTDYENESFEDYEARMKAGIIRDLSPTQEKQLLSYNAKGDFEYGANLRETMRVLEEKGYLTEKNRRLILTPKAKDYLDAHSHDILSDRFLSTPKYKKEMTLPEKRELQRQLDKADILAKKAKMIPESRGQMTLFGGLGYTIDPKYNEAEPYKMTSREFYDTNKRFIGIHQSLDKLADKIMDKERQGRQRRFDIVLKHPDNDNYHLINQYENELKFLQEGIAKIDRTNHKDLVSKAIKQGKPIPEKILREYPDLKRKILPKQTSFTERSQMTLFGLGRIDNCYKYLTMKGFGPTEACFHGESTRGKGTATFTATDKSGHTIPGMITEKVMTFDKFYDMMERNKARWVS